MGQSEFKHINYYNSVVGGSGGGGSDGGGDDNKNGDGKLCCKQTIYCPVTYQPIAGLNNMSSTQLRR